MTADSAPVSRAEAAKTGRDRPMVLVVDNYDSFVYNLVQYVGTHADVEVRRNDAIDVEGIRDLDPDGIVVSPGPGTPAEAGVSIPIFEELDYPTLGVCLGHQALCAASGADVGNAPEVVHGKPSTVAHDGRGVFEGLPGRIEVGRYHSLAVERDDIPSVLEETARTEDERGVVMGVRHREKPHAGVQFHPESILTDVGKRMIETFCELCAVDPTDFDGVRDNSGAPDTVETSGASDTVETSGASDTDDTTG